MAPEGAHDDFVTEALGDQRRDEHIRIEDDGHETIANTSSSV